VFFFYWEKSAGCTLFVVVIVANLAILMSISSKRERETSDGMRSDNLWAFCSFSVLFSRWEMTGEGCAGGDSGVIIISRHDLSSFYLGGGGVSFYLFCHVDIPVSIFSCLLTLSVPWSLCAFFYPHRCY